MNKFLAMIRAVEPTKPLDKTTMVAGTSKALGRVPRRQKEVLSQSKAEPKSRAADGWTLGCR